MANCSEDLPYAKDYLKGLRERKLRVINLLTTYAIISKRTAFISPELSAMYIAFFSIVGVLTLIVLVFYLETTVFFMTRMKYWKPRDKAKWLIAVYPIMCLTAFIGLIVPRSAILNDLVSAAMKLQLLQAAILQFTLVRSASSYALGILWSDELYGSEDFFSNADSYIEILVIASTLLAMWAFNVVYRLSRVPLSHTAVKPKFLCLQLVLFINGIQRSILNVFVAVNVINCEPPLNAQGNADRKMRLRNQFLITYIMFLGWNHILIIIWMFIIFFFARKYYRRHVTNVPKEDLITSETMTSKSTHTTDTLTREQVDFTYGAMGDGSPGTSNPNFNGESKGIDMSTGTMDEESYDSDMDELGQPNPEGPVVKARTHTSDLADNNTGLDESKISLEIRE
ncbi:hypothetical protein CAPTEDRAFT_187911 [Capitella teleta]|uniref:Uncharacterized protein n=1 Tax=Capitella teleta TaxID=283909 RepID=R7UBB3_CAPTE|nr:hypothetical protein CAPTEDRAFT_187911 [Capitella teleta]|eukprot:ELU01088.1 hypothetical protein CAPTEDRAFT_187911 [Capitella teleta]